MIAEAMYLELGARFQQYDTATQRPDLLILTVLSGIAGGAEKHYCYPSQEKIRELLGRYGRHMSRRTLNRHLNALVAHGWIKRRRRHTHHAARGWCFKSSLYTLTRRAYRWLYGLRNAVVRAVKWGKSFKRTSRVPDMAQHNPPRDINTGCAPKSGAPPGPVESVAGAGGARTESKAALDALATLKRMVRH